MISVVDKETRCLLKKGGYWGKALMPFKVGAKLDGTSREQYRQMTMRTGRRKFPWELVWKGVVLLLLVKTAFSQQPPARATALAPVHTENKMVPLSVDLTGALRTSGGGGSGGGLTDAQLRASPVPMSLSTAPLPNGAATETTLSSILGRLPALVTGRIPVDGSGVTQPVSGTVGVSNFPSTQAVTGTFWQATQPVSIAATVAVSGPLTDAQLRATAVPVSGTVTANAGTGTMNVNCTGGCAGASEGITYIWSVPDAVAGANKLFLDLFNASGSGKIIKVRGIYPYIKTDVAVVGALAIRWDVFRTSAVGTGGTPAVYQSATRDVAGGSINPMDTLLNPSLPAQVTARHLPTAGATAAAWMGQAACFTEETNASTYFCSGQTNYLPLVTGGQALVLREGQGILIQQGAVASLNNIAFKIVFTVE